MFVILNMKPEVINNLECVLRKVEVRLCSCYESQQPITKQLAGSAVEVCLSMFLHTSFLHCGIFSGPLEFVKHRHGAGQVGPGLFLRRVYSPPQT